jgi:hypothetical protein
MEEIIMIARTKKVILVLQSFRKVKAKCFINGTNVYLSLK